MGVFFSKKKNKNEWAFLKISSAREGCSVELPYRPRKQITKLFGHSHNFKFMLE